MIGTGLRLGRLLMILQRGAFFSLQATFSTMAWAPITICGVFIPDLDSIISIPRVEVQCPSNPKLVSPAGARSRDWCIIWLYLIKLLLDVPLPLLDPLD